MMRSNRRSVPLRMREAALVAVSISAILVGGAATAGASSQYLVNPPPFYYYGGTLDSEGHAFGPSWELRANPVPRGGYPYGVTRFFSKGEHLAACDFAGDGRFVRAEAQWHEQDSGRLRTVTVNDTTKEKTSYFNDCSDVNLDIPERVPVQIRVCVQDLGCTEWREVNA